MPDSTRREIISLLGTAGIASIAGCGSNIDASTGETVDKDVSLPSTNPPKGWQRTNSDSNPVVMAQGTKSGVDWTAVGRTIQYEDKQLRRFVKEQTFGRVDRALLIGFATKIGLFPKVARNIGGLFRSEVVPNVDEQIKSKMRKFGLSNVTRTGTTDWDYSKPNQLRTFSGKYDIPEITIDNVDIPNIQKDSFTIGGKPIDIAGRVGIWRENEHWLVAGGIYPDQSFTDDKRWEVNDSITVSVNIHLTFGDAATDTLTFIRNVRP